LTLADLADMAHVRLSSDWDHTSAVMALLATIHRDPNKHGPFSPAEFHPYKGQRRTSRGIPITRENIGILKVFVGRKRK